MERVLPGDPETMVGLAAALRGRARWYGALVDVAYLCAGAVWDSPAGTALGARLAQLAPALSALVRRYGDAADAIEELADELAQAQQASRSAIQRTEWARADLIAVQREQGATTDPARQAALDRAADEARRRLLQATGDVQVAEGRWLRADDRCGRRLTALGHDEISDPLGFTAGRYAGRLCTAVGLVGVVPHPITRGVSAIAGSTAFVIDVALFLRYGEGSWKALASQVGWQTLGSTRAILKAGSRVSGGADAALTARLTAGAKIAAKERAPFGVLGRPPAVTVPGRPLTEVGRHAAPPSSRLAALGVAAQTRVLAAVEQRYAASWRIATAEGPVAQRLLVSSWTIEGGTTAYKKAESVRQRFEPQREERTSSSTP